MGAERSFTQPPKRYRNLTEHSQNRGFGSNRVCYAYFLAPAE